jgi:hypothetical protein
MERKQTAVVSVKKEEEEDWRRDWSVGRDGYVVDRSVVSVKKEEEEDWRRDWSVGRDGYVVDRSVVSVKKEEKEECSSKIDASTILHESFKGSTSTLLRVEGKATQEDASDDENLLVLEDGFPRTPGWTPELLPGLGPEVPTLQEDAKGVEALTSKSSIGVPVDSNGREIAQYELDRLKRVQNNEELLIRLEIVKPPPLSVKPVQVKRRNFETGTEKPKKIPTRKSPRASALPMGALNEEAGAGNEFDDFEDVGVRRYSFKKRAVSKDSSLSPRSPIVSRMHMRVTPVEQPKLGPFSYDRYESFLHEKVGQMRPVFGFTEMHVKNLDKWIIHDRQFNSTQKARCQLMIKTQTSTISDNLDDILNLLGYSKKRQRSGDVFTRYVWCPHIVLVNIFKGCTKQNLAYDRQKQSYFHPGIDVDVDTTRKNPNIQILCPVRLRELSELIRGDSGQDAEADLVPVEELPKFADFEKIVKMELDPEKYFFPFMSLDCEENRELFEVKSKSVDKDNADLRMVRIPGVLNLTEKRENQILAVYECLQDVKMISEDQVEVRLFKPVGEWD